MEKLIARRQQPRALEDLAKRLQALLVLRAFVIHDAEIEELRLLAHQLTVARVQDINVVGVVQDLSLHYVELQRNRMLLSFCGIDFLPQRCRRYWAHVKSVLFKSEWKLCVQYDALTCSFNVERQGMAGL